jgi:hypothetical protein
MFHYISSLETRLQTLVTLSQSPAANLPLALENLVSQNLDETTCIKAVVLYN